MDYECVPPDECDGVEVRVVARCLASEHLGEVNAIRLVLGILATRTHRNVSNSLNGHGSLP
jgi:hypothetical protein